MYKGKKVAGFILIAGKSARYGKHKNKNFELINGRFVVEYSIEAFCQNSFIDEVVIAVRDCDLTILGSILSRVSPTKSVTVVFGGRTRKESVFNCLMAAGASIVVIHDGARPLIKQEYINDCVQCMEKYRGAAVGVKSKDTVKITDDDGVVIKTTNRNNTWVIQTPQCFDKSVLLEMHKRFHDTNVTDDCSLLEMGGYKVKIIPSDYTNIKITTPEDLEFVKICASALLEEENT